jgi:DNA-directed RNA polymerase sigma subunit (sigma70/sigma32)
MSFVEVGKRKQVSKEYTRQLCHAALEKLRRAANNGELNVPAFQF